MLMDFFNDPEKYIKKGICDGIDYIIKYVVNFLSDVPGMILDGVKDFFVAILKPISSVFSGIFDTIKTFSKTF